MMRMRKWCKNDDDDDDDDDNNNDDDDTGNEGKTLTWEEYCFEL